LIPSCLAWVNTRCTFPFFCRSAGAALPTPPVNGFAATPTKANPKIDLLSGDLLSSDDLSMPGSQDTLALVPVSTPQPSSPVASQQNALALVPPFLGLHSA